MKSGVTLESVKISFFTFALIATGNAAAAGIPVWSPTSSSIQTITLELLGIDDGVDFAIFDDTDLGVFIAPLTLDTPLGAATINTSNNGDGTWHFEDASNAANSLNVSSGSFIFAFTTDSGTTWSTSVDSWTEISAGTWRIAYPGTTATINLTAVDVTPVPTPAAIWLFGSSLIGLAGFARRKPA